jgi:hypothetical protein
MRFQSARITAKPPVLSVSATAPAAFAKTAIRPRGGVIGRFANYRLVPPTGVVVLIPVCRGRAAVTLGHDTSSLGPGRLPPATVVAGHSSTLPSARYWEVALVRFAVPF